MVILLNYLKYIIDNNKYIVFGCNISSIKGHGRVLDCLIGNDAIVDVANRDGNTPLHFAVKYGNLFN